MSIKCTQCWYYTYMYMYVAISSCYWYFHCMRLYSSDNIAKCKCSYSICAMNQKQSHGSSAARNCIAIVSLSVTTDVQSATNQTHLPCYRLFVIFERDAFAMPLPLEQTQLMRAFGWNFSLPIPSFSSFGVNGSFANVGQTVCLCCMYPFIRRSSVCRSLHWFLTLTRMCYLFVSFLRSFFSSNSTANRYFYFERDYFVADYNNTRVFTFQYILIL